jgi:putative membrane-bound dehydrogenase-like protein
MVRRVCPFRSFARAVLAACLFGPAAWVSAAEEVGVAVPEGFKVELYADDELAHDIFSMTVDASGRVVVSGPGYVRILLDKDGDGKADSFKQFADGPASGAQGMYFYGSDLLCTGDAGLIRYRDADRDDRADGPPDLFLKLKTGGEHNAHAIRRGPDGWWYIIAGNTTEVTSGYVTLPTSPVKYPEHGVLLRLRPDLAGGEIFAHGFRNAYDFDFGPQGEPYSFDSDDERDVSLPWYRPTRVFELLPAAHVGWLSKSWKRPDQFLDMPPVVAAFGRASPTGVVSYHHQQFPEPYRGCVFALDWTFGRVWAIPLKRAGDHWTGEPIEFMTARGQFGFAPTDAEIGPDGSLYVSVGGRGTRGGVFRVTHDKTASTSKVAPKVPKTAAESLTACLEAPQPLSSWSRQRWEPLARNLGAQPFVHAALNAEASVPSRVRAIEILTELYYGLPADAAAQLAKAEPAEVRARAAWSLERAVPQNLDPNTIAALVQDSDPLVRRYALEFLATYPQFAVPQFPSIGLAQALGDEHKFVRMAAARATAALNESFYAQVGNDVKKTGWRAAVTYAVAQRLRTTTAQPTLDAYAIEVGRRVLDGKHPLDLKLDAIRLIQLGLGDLGSYGKLPAAFDGYASPLDLSKYERELDLLRISAANLYPTGDRQVDTELARLLAVLTVYNPEFLDKLLAGITPESDPVDDIHRLFVASRIPVEHSAKQRSAIAKALVDLEPKILARKLGQDSNWDISIGQMYEQLADVDTDIPAQLLAETGFGRPGHVKFLSRVPSELVPDAVAAFAKAVAADSDYPWNNDVVFLFGTIDTEANWKLVREQYTKFSLRSAVLMTLAKKPDEQDREKFIEGLDSSQVEVLTACVDALEQLPRGTSAAEAAALVRLLRRLGTDATEFPIREKVVRLLQRHSGKQYVFVFGPAGHRPQPATVQAWTGWLSEVYPEEAARLLGGSDAELADLKKLLDGVNWSAGDPARGQKIFQARSCAQCHGGGRALGPDLSGVAGRFSREDLFMAIALPNRDVSPRYQTTLIEGKDGKVYSGLIIYESVDGVLLRNSTNQTFRLEAAEIEHRRRLNTSLMPTGLLKDLDKSDVADLYSYLQSLTARTAAAD